MSEKSQIRSDKDSVLSKEEVLGNHSQFAEKELSRHILRRLKEKKISLRRAAELIQPPLTASQIHHILSGKSPLSMERFYEFARILQMDPVDLMMEASGHRPTHAYLLSPEQEAFICMHPLNYKLAYTCFHSESPVTQERFHELFPESRHDIAKSLKKLVSKGILRCPTPEAYESPFEQIPKFHFTPDYEKLLARLAMECHQSAASIGNDYPHLAKYVLTKYHLAFLTPEQMVQVRAELVKLQEIIWSFQHQNQSNEDLAKLSERNFMALMTFFAPINPVSFVRTIK